MAMVWHASDIQGRYVASALKPGKAKALERALRMCYEKRPYVESSSSACLSFDEQDLGEKPFAIHTCAQRVEDAETPEAHSCHTCRPTNRPMEAEHA